MTARFAETRWSLVQKAQGQGNEARAALSELCEAYYAPVQEFIRHWRGNAEAARDLTQEFFARLLEKNHLAGAGPERGRFRSFLLGAVKHFLCDARDREQALKRGGGVEHVAIADSGEINEPGLPPDAAFDRHWALATLERALRSLETALADEGRRELFEALRPWLAGMPRDGSARETAFQLGLNEGAFRVALHRLRQRFREQLRREVAQTLAPQADVEEELRHLLAAVTG